jgi:hypothetical protein
MSNRKFLVSMTALVAAVGSQQASANVEDVKAGNLTALTQSALVSNNQNPFDFVLKRSDSAIQVLSYHSSHSSHSSHASHSSHYSSRY